MNRTNVKSSVLIGVEYPQGALKDKVDVLGTELLEVPDGWANFLLRVVLVLAHLPQQLDRLLVHVLAVVQVEQLAIFLPDHSNQSRLPKDEEEESPPLP